MHRLDNFARQQTDLESLPLMTREQLREIEARNVQAVANLIIRSHQNQPPITEHKPDTSVMLQKKITDLPLMTREQLRKIGEDNVQAVANLIIRSHQNQPPITEAEYERREMLREASKPPHTAYKISPDDFVSGGGRSFTEV